MMKIPTKKWLLLIVVLASIDLMHFVLLNAFPAYDNDVFLGQNDYFIDTCAMISPITGFTNPFSAANDNILTIPGLTSPYFFIPLGIISMALNIPAIVMLLIANYVITFLFLIVCYNIIDFFVQNRKQFDITYALFLMPLGGGSLFLFMTYRIGGLFSFISNNLTWDFTMLSYKFGMYEFTLVYFWAAMTIGLIGLNYFLHGKKNMGILFT